MRRIAEMQKIAGKQASYDTWYAFKKEMESTLCCHIDNPLWLEIKPKKALPWNNLDMRSALNRVLEI
jgi:hypothetical protein